MTERAPPPPPSTATPNRLILQPLDRVDPRGTLDEGALVAASFNAFPIVARRQARRDTGGLLVGGAVALLLGGLTFWSMSGHRAAPPQAVPAPARLGSPVFRSPPTALAPTPPPSLMMPSVPSTMPQMAAPAPAPVMVYDGGNAPAALTAAPTGPGVAPGATAARAPAALGNTENEQFAARVGGGGSTDVATAQQLSNPATTVTQGTLIPAVLETAIDTDLPGYVRAVVSRDVKSFDGSRVMIPRSSRLIGQYKSGLAAGQTRAYIIWSRLIRPDGVSVALASPAVEFNGTSGLSGRVDSHFMKRFGAAALLTVIGGLPALVGNSSSVVLSSGQSAAGAAVQGNTAIPPTIHVAQGQPIRVFTARDLDFSTVADDSARP